MIIGTIGYNYSHGKDFIIDKPNGHGCWVFLLIKTSAFFEINGQKQLVRENSYIIMSPDTSCKYYSHGNIYTDDWIYFDIEFKDLELFESLNIPVNKAQYLGNIEELSQIIHIMTYEHYSTENFKDKIEKKYTEILLFKLARLIQSKASISSNLFRKKNYKMTQLRTRIYTLPNTIPNVKGMAQEIGMSVSGFQHLYKKMFGVNVMADVINGRLNYATQLLSLTNMTIKEISEMCGYSNEYNFMRQFKKKYYKTPTQYRKCM